MSVKNLGGYSSFMCFNWATSTPYMLAVKLCRSVKVVVKAKMTNQTAMAMSTLREDRGAAATDDIEAAEDSETSASAVEDGEPRLGGMIEIGDGTWAGSGCLAAVTSRG